VALRDEASSIKGRYPQRLAPQRSQDQPSALRLAEQIQMLHIAGSHAQVAARPKAGNRPVGQPSITDPKVPSTTGRYNQIVRLGKEPVAAQVEQPLERISLRPVIGRQHHAAVDCRLRFAQLS
jgi:hypothetical protein